MGWLGRVPLERRGVFEYSGYVVPVAGLFMIIMLLDHRKCLVKTIFRLSSVFPEA